MVLKRTLSFIKTVLSSTHNLGVGLVKTNITHSSGGLTFTNYKAESLL